MSEKTCTLLVRRRAASPDQCLDEYSAFLPCESCGGYSNRLERHHRQFRSRGGLWVPSNILLICDVCHMSATDEAPWTQGSGMNVHSFEEPAEVPVSLWHAGLVLLDNLGAYVVLDNAGQ